LGLRISGFTPGGEYLWHPDFDLFSWNPPVPPPPVEFELDESKSAGRSMGGLGPLANYDLLSFRKVNFGMSYQELIETLGDPSEQWTVLFPEKNEGTLRPLIPKRSSLRSFLVKFFQIPVVEEHLGPLTALSGSMRRSFLGRTKVDSPLFLYFYDYPELLFYLVSVKLPIGKNPDHRTYNTVSFLQDILDLYAVNNGNVLGFPLVPFLNSKRRNIYSIREIHNIKWVHPRHP